MKIQIDDLRDIQNALDSRIFSLHNTSREATRNDRVLALLVELGECANETRCFKYWSLKQPASNDLIFEKFSDVVHFVLSLGIDINHEEKVVEYVGEDISINDHFHRMFEATHIFSKSNTIEDYNKLLVTLFNLADAIGMSGEDIRKMYLMKNEKNHQRQDNKY